MHIAQCPPRYYLHVSEYGNSLYGWYCSNALNSVSSVNVMDVCFMLPLGSKRSIYANRIVSAFGLAFTNSIHLYK